jgi:hypothetical protein
MNHLVMTNCYVQVATGALNWLYSLSSNIIRGTAIGLTMEVGATATQYDIAGLGTAAAIGGIHI